MRGSPEKLDTGQSPVLGEADKKMLEKLACPEHGHPRFRSRFMSISKSRRRRRSRTRLSVEGRLLVDEFYTAPAQILLSRLGDWDFNIFTLDVLAGGRSLFHVAYHLFQTYDLTRVFQLDSLRLLQFFSLVEENYHESNPYHNAVHAADVTQSMHCYLQEREVYDSTSHLEKMAALVASLTHDLDHPGVNNTFLIVTSNHLATLYQNISVLENHHWRSAVGLLQETGLLSHFTCERRDYFTGLLKSLILATDITRQQEFLLKFNRYIEGGEFQYRWKEDHRHFMLQIALKCADISNPCRPWKVSQRWSRRVCNEFFLQGDTERVLDVDVTPLCDRHNNTVANIQHGFMQFVVHPLFKAWDKFMGTELSHQMLDHLSHNQGVWKGIMDKGEEISELTSDEEGGEDTGFKNLKNVSRRSSQASRGEHLEEERVESISKLHIDDREVCVEDINIQQDLGQLNTENSSKWSGKEDEEEEEMEEEEEGKSEEDDIVENNVNLVYHYQTDSEHSEQSGRCLSPVSEDMEQSLLASSSAGIRRFSMPHVIRKDLNFYLGLRKDGSGSRSQFLRRQSLPVTAMYFRGSTSTDTPVSEDSQSRSLSMDALLVRPKISNLSPSMEGGFISGGLDQLSFIPLQKQTLMLQGSSLTRFTSNPTSRRSSADHAILEQLRINSNANLCPFPSDLLIPPYKSGIRETNINQPFVGLASSWPSITRRKITNGSTQHLNATVSSSFTTTTKPSPSYSPLDNGGLFHLMGTSSTHTHPTLILSNREDLEGNNNSTSNSNLGPESSSFIPEGPDNNDNRSLNHPQCLSLTTCPSCPPPPQ